MGEKREVIQLNVLNFKFPFHFIHNIFLLQITFKDSLVNK